MRKLLTLFFFFCGKAYSQNNAATLHNLLSGDSSTTRVVFSYPDAIRQAAFTAATYPEGFMRLGAIQKETSRAFQKLVSGYKQNRQKQLWDIARYPELPSLLVNNKNKPESELQELLKNYPKETRKSALYFVRNDVKVIEGMDQIRLDFEAKYKAMVRDFPANVQASYTQLVNDPELLFILANDMHSTVAIGDIQKRDPGLLKQVADSVSRQVAEENGVEYEAWKKGISSDPNVQKELKQVTKKYAEENPYTDDVYADRNYKGSDDPVPREEEIRDVAATRPYPYWAGYPYWYDTPYWYPYPWWYNSGFYWGPGGSMVFFGMPSYHFGWWYYSHPHYTRYYRRTSDYFNRHYSSHPRSGSGFNRSVRDFNRGGGGARPAPGGGRMSGGGVRRR